MDFEGNIQPLKKVVATTKFGQYGIDFWFPSNEEKGNKASMTDSIRLSIKNNIDKVKVAT